MDAWAFVDGSTFDYDQFIHEIGQIVLDAHWPGVAQVYTDHVRLQTGARQFEEAAQALRHACRVLSQVGSQRTQLDQIGLTTSALGDRVADIGRNLDKLAQALLRENGLVAIATDVADVAGATDAHSVAVARDEEGRP